MSCSDAHRETECDVNAGVDWMSCAANLAYYYSFISAGDLCVRLLLTASLASIAGSREERASCNVVILSSTQIQDKRIAGEKLTNFGKLAGIISIREIRLQLLSSSRNSICGSCFSLSLPRSRRCPDSRRSRCKCSSLLHSQW